VIIQINKLKDIFQLSLSLSSEKHLTPLKIILETLFSYFLDQNILSIFQSLSQLLLSFAGTSFSSILLW
jgi:hypothetical protein